MSERLSHGELLQLKRWNTPTIYNGWEQITRHNSACEGFNLEETRDFMPQMGPMIGYAVTATFQPGNPEHPKKNPKAWDEYLAYIAGVPGPKIVVIRDLDKPHVYGAIWGEVMANMHRAMGCVGTITDGAVRDVDEMTNAGFKALARRMAVGHACACPVQWGLEVEVFGRKIAPGQLVHADKHGFLAVPPEDAPRLLEAANFMDRNECHTLIEAARNASGKSAAEVLASFRHAFAAFRENAQKQFGGARKGEW